MKKIIYTFSLAMWVLVQGAQAQTLTLEQSIRSVWENSPQLKAQKALAGIYSDDTWRRWLPLEPTMSWTDNYSDTFWTWGLSLTYPIPFKSLAFTQLDSAMAESQRWEFTAQKFDLAVSITAAYMNGASAQAMIYFQKQNVQDLETITDAIRNQYVHGQSNQVNKISAELQLTAAQRDLKTAEDQLDTAVELYARLMGISPSQVTGFILPEDLPSSIVKELGNKTSAQLRDKYNVDVAEANRATGFWNQVPDPTFTVSKDYYNPNTSFLDSPTGNPNDYNFTISFTLPILFPFREMAEAQRSENQATDSREMSKFSLVNDNNAQESAAMDYRRSKNRFNQLHSRDLILAETMMEAALEAYKRGQFEFTALMLAHQTYAAAKEEDIQIRAEIVNMRLAGLVGDDEPQVGGRTDYSSNLPNTDTYLSVNGEEKELTPASMGKATSSEKIHYSNNSNPEKYNAMTTNEGETTTADETTSPVPKEQHVLGTNKSAELNGNPTPGLLTSPVPTPTMGTNSGDSSTEAN